MQFYSPSSIHEIFFTFPHMDAFRSYTNFSSDYQMQIQFRWHLNFGLWNHLEAKMEQRLQVYWWAVRWRENWVLRRIQALTVLLWSHIINSERKQNLGIGNPNSSDIQVFQPLRILSSPIQSAEEQKGEGGKVARHQVICEK